MEHENKQMAGVGHGKFNPLVRLELGVWLPYDIEASEDEVREWIEYNTGNRRYIARENPLCHYGLKGEILGYESND